MASRLSLSKKMNVMADDKSKRDFRDRTRINPDEQYEIQYWSERFGVTEKKLNEAIKVAGPMVANVRKQLHK
jgi:hypothetical protein